MFRHLAGLGRWLETEYGIDVRSLAAFRVGLAALLFLSLTSRFSDIQAFYSDEGLLPRIEFIKHFSANTRFCFHLANGTVLGQQFFFALHATAALAMLIGYRTRLASVVCWVMTISLIARNGMVMNGGDDLMRLLLFWSLFLPLGAAFSIDAALRTESGAPRPQRIFSGGSIAVMAQALIVYVLTAQLKSGVEWHAEGSAIYYALNCDLIAKPLGKSLLAYPEFLRVLTHGSYWLERFGPLLLVVPARWGAVRLLGVILFALFHLGILLTMEVGEFPLVDIVSLIVFLPSSFWDGCASVGPKTRVREIFFDGDCGFCKKTLYLIRHFFMLEKVPVRTAQSDAAIFRLMEKENSWVILDADGSPRFKFEAFCLLCRSSPLFFWLEPLLRLGPIFAIGTAVYEWVADHRPAASRAVSFLSFREQRYAPGRVSGALALVFLLYVCWWNVATIKKSWMPTVFKRPGTALYLDQNWRMFAPKPAQDDGWFVTVATLDDEREVDVLRGGAPVNWEKPEHVVWTFKNFRWRKYMVNLKDVKDARRRREYRRCIAKYLYRKWTAEHPDAASQIQKLEIYFVLERTHLEGTEAPRKYLLWRYFPSQDKPKPQKTLSERLKGLV